MPELSQAIIAVFGLLLAAALRLLQKKLLEAETKRHDCLSEEDLFVDGVKNFRVVLREFNIICKAIDAAKRKNIDRVLILVCVNGITKPERASVLFDSSDIEIGTYDDVRLDSDYQDKINYIIRHNYLTFKTSEARNTIIGGYYDMEGVKSSIWVAIGRKQSVNTEQVAYLYMTASSHTDDDMGNDEVISAQNIASLFRNIAKPHGYRPI